MNITDLHLCRFKVQQQGHSWLHEYVCGCGNLFLATKHNIDKGKIKSCGCYKKKIVIIKNTTHGLSRIDRRLYQCWKSMIGRCYNQSNSAYKYYGGRGISVCDEWRFNYNVFYTWAVSNGYRLELTLDRIDVNGGYNILNCRWANSKTTITKS